MTDKIPSFKEEIDNIHVPFDKLDAIISKTIHENHQRGKKSLRMKMVYSLSSVAVASILFVSSATVSPAMAKIVSKIPIIGAVFSESGDPGLEKVHEQGLTNLIGDTKNTGGTSITLDEVFYDGTRFTIGFSIISENIIEKSYLSSGPEIKINGQAFSNASTYSETKISPTHRTGIINIDSLDDLPEAFTLGVNFTSVDGKQWDFSTPVSMKTEVEYLTINHSQTVEDINLTVSDLEISAAGLRFNFNADTEKINYLTNGYLDFKVIDDKGNELISHSGGSQIQNVDGKEELTGSLLIDPIKDNAKTLKVIPYINFHQGGTSVEVDLKGNETKTNIQPFNETDIEFKSFTVTLP
ncbi:DUF4179 domain-containing protein [Viridibacillus arvi]|uniref:DUF4179 domain-containing protein n=1 Tax=Viridibacillus arvi TaxID=263475 RepID=UPI003D063B1F